MERRHSSPIPVPFSNANLIPETAATSPVKMEFGYPCAQCGALTSNIKIAKLHNDAHYTGHSCPYCPQVFFTEHVLNMHKGFHKKMRKAFVEDNCQCKVCEAAFISLLYLEFHLIQFHGNDVLNNPGAIRLDVIEERESNKLSDSKDRNYRCGFCLRLFEFAANLECHMTLHPNGKFECNKCSAKFSASETLQMHVNSRHLENHETEVDFVHSKNIISKPIQIRGGVPKTMMNCKWQLDQSTKESTASPNTINQLQLRKAIKLSCHQNIRNIPKVPHQEECQYGNILFFNLNLPKAINSTIIETRDESNVKYPRRNCETEYLHRNDSKLYDDSHYINPYLIKVMLTTKWKAVENNNIGEKQ